MKRLYKIAAISLTILLMATLCSCGQNADSVPPTSTSPSPDVTTRAPGSSGTSSEISSSTNTAPTSSESTSTVAANSAPTSNTGTNASPSLDTSNNSTAMEMNIASPQAALDAVKSYIENQSDSSDIFSSLDSNVNPPAYYFQGSNILIQYDSSHSDANGTYYLIHEYEYVVDNPKTGWGHTVTYNWFRVDAQTGDITPLYDSDGSLNSNY